MTLLSTLRKQVRERIIKEKGIELTNASNAHKKYLTMANFRPIDISVVQNSKFLGGICFIFI
jgi:hypothetical protein